MITHAKHFNVHGLIDVCFVCASFRMRECGEEMLVDMSEVLFNELAFFRLMQDLDEPTIADKIRTNAWFQVSNSFSLCGSEKVLYLSFDTEHHLSH